MAKGWSAFTLESMFELMQDETSEMT